MAQRAHHMRLVHAELTVKRQCTNCKQIEVHTQEIQLGWLHLKLCQPNAILNQYRDRSDGLCKACEKASLAALAERKAQGRMLG